MYRRKFFFGKHKGEFILDVIENDTQYITWCIEHVEFLKFNEMEVTAYNKKLKTINNDIHSVNIKGRNALEEEFYRMMNN